MTAVLNAEEVEAEEIQIEESAAVEEIATDPLESAAAQKKAKPVKAKASLASLDMLVDSKVLLTAVQNVIRAVPARSSMPILQHLRLTTGTDGRAELLATDLKRFVSCSFPAETLSAGSVTLPAKWIQELLSRLPSAPVRLSVESTEDAGASRPCRLKCSGSNYKVLGFDAEEFPVFPVTEPEAALTMDAGDFCQALAGTLFSCSKDETRTILLGALLDFTITELSGGFTSLGIVATDTHRLARTFCRVRHSTGEPQSAIVPQNTLLDIAALAKGAADVTMSFVRSKTNKAAQVRFDIAPKPVSGGGKGSDAANEGMIVSVLTRLVDGQFPNWERIVPYQHDGSLLAERKPLIDAVRRAALVAKDAAKRVVLTRREDDALVISAESGSVGNAEEVLADIAWTGETCPQIAVNYEYLLDALDAAQGDGVTLETTQALRPIVLRGDEMSGSGWFALLMPMQVG